MAQLVSSIKLSELRLTKSLLVNFSNKDAKVKRNNNGQLYFHCYYLARQKSFRLLREVTSAQFVDIYIFFYPLQLSNLCLWSKFSLTDSVVNLFLYTLALWSWTFRLWIIDWLQNLSRIIVYVILKISVVILRNQMSSKKKSATLKAPFLIFHSWSIWWFC